MNDAAEPPKLTPWPFVLSDIVLTGTAFLIAYSASGPLQGTPLIAVLLCVVLGATALCIPFVVNHAHRQETALAERQREIAALAQTTAASAEQLSIAAASLHSISESALKASKVVEQLPQRLQEKVNEFKARLNEVVVDENEALTQELNSLRTSEAERLEGILDRIQKMATEWREVDGAVRKSLTEGTEAIESWPAKFTAFLDLQASEFETRVKEVAARAETRIKAAVSTPPFPQWASSPPIPLPPPDPLPPHSSGPIAVDSNVDRPADPKPPAAAASDPGDAYRPASFDILPNDAVSAVPPSVPLDVSSAPFFIPAKEPVKRVSRRSPSEAEQGMDLGLDLGEISQEAPDDAIPSISADGQTRLVVTAYIGIGNKLFVRGDGPGLNWEKGAPLTFVSIGKWRWETAEATAPITLKLLKNDQQAAGNLGTLTLIPGHQHEVKAKF